MIVQCPYCATRYELDTARLTGSNPVLKCSRCRHVFPAPRGKKQAPVTEPAPDTRAAPADGNLTLPFDEPTWKDEEEPAAPVLGAAEPEEGFTLGTEEEPKAFTFSPPPPEPPAPRRGKRAPAADEDDEDDSPPAADRPASRERGKLSAIFVFLTLVVSAYAVLTRALFASPALCDRLVGRVPLIGSLGSDRLLTRKVALLEVTGAYQRIKDGKDVFVISGKALNTAPVALHGVQIVGKLFDAKGATLDQKVINCGNVISAKVLKDLTPRELSILQKLSPPKRFTIEPGESSTFVIVFMDPPRAASEYTAQVAAAQRQT